MHCNDIGDKTQRDEPENLSETAFRSGVLADLDQLLQLGCPDDILLGTREAGVVLNLTVRGLEDLRMRGDGPKFVRIGRRAVRYRLTDLRAWISARIKSSTTEE